MFFLPRLDSADLDLGSSATGASADRSIETPFDSASVRKRSFVRRLMRCLSSAFCCLFKFVISGVLAMYSQEYTFTKMAERAERV